MRDYLAMWKNYANFAGKTSRSAYAFALLLHLVICFLLILLAVQSQVSFFNVCASLYSLATSIPILSLYIRRLHDAGMSWLWVFTLPLPLLGVAVMVLLACKEST